MMPSTILFESQIIQLEFMQGGGAQLQNHRSKDLVFGSSTTRIIPSEAVIEGSVEEKENPISASISQ
jgi:hypothetical protein